MPTDSGNINNSGKTITDLPVEILCAMLDTLVPQEIIAFCRNNQALHTYLKKYQPFWKKQLARHFPHQSEILQATEEFQNDQGNVFNVDYTIDYYKAFCKATYPRPQTWQSDDVKKFHTLLLAGNSEEIKKATLGDYSVNELNLEVFVVHIDSLTIEQINALPQSSRDILFELLIEKAEQSQNFFFRFFSSSNKDNQLPQHISDKTLMLLAKQCIVFNQLMTLQKSWKDEYNQTVQAQELLLLAIRYNRTKIVDFFLEKNVPITINTFFAASSSEINIQIFEKLLAEEPFLNINARQFHHGYTLLHAACQNGHLALVQLLLSRPGIDIAVTRARTATTKAHSVNVSVLEDACINGHVSVVQELLKHTAIDKQITHELLVNLYKDTTLDVAIRHKIIKSLFSKAIEPRLPVVSQLLASALQYGDELTVSIVLGKLTADTAKVLINNQIIFSIRQIEKTGTLLHQAIHMHHKQTVKRLLELNAKLDQTPLTPLVLALTMTPTLDYSTSQEIILLLIDHIKTLTTEQRDKVFRGSIQDDVPPLGIAINKRNWRIVNALLHAGINPNQAIRTASVPISIGISASAGATIVVDSRRSTDTDIDVTTPLALAIDAAQQDIVDLLLEKGAAINPNVHFTPLMAACTKKDLATAKKLIEKGAKLDVWLPSCGTLLHLAIANFDNTNEGAQALVTLLLESNFPKALIDKPNTNLKTALELAIANDDTEIVTLLLNAGADINRQLKNNSFTPPLYGYTPLHYAIKRQNKRMVTLLLQQGALTTPVYDFQHTTLQAALDTENITIITQVLNAKDLAINQINSYENTALNYFINPHASNRSAHNYRNKTNQEDILTLLLNIPNIDVNLANHGGCTPLWNAIHYRNLIFVEKLLEKGANANGTLPDGEPLLHYAITREKSGLSKLLLTYGVNTNTLYNDPEHGNTALQWAVAVGNEEAITLLLEKGAQIDPPTILHRLAKAGTMGRVSTQIVETLLKHGAKANDENPEKQTALDIVINMSSSGNPDRYSAEIAASLLNHGADPTRPVVGGSSVFTSAIYLTVSKNLIELTRVLLTDPRVQKTVKDFNPTQGGTNTLHLAAYQGHRDIFMALLPYADITVLTAEAQYLFLRNPFTKNENEMYIKMQQASLLHLAAHSGNCALVTDVLHESQRQNFPCINLADGNGLTPLYYAVIGLLSITKTTDPKPHLDTIQFLLENGAEPEFKDKSKRYPLPRTMLKKLTNEALRKSALATFDTAVKTYQQKPKTQIIEKIPSAIPVPSAPVRNTELAKLNVDDEIAKETLTQTIEKIPPTIPVPSAPVHNTELATLNVDNEIAKETLEYYWDTIVAFGQLKGEEALTFRLGGEKVELTCEDKKLSLKLPKHTVEILEEIIIARNSSDKNAYKDALINVNKIFARAEKIPKGTSPRFFFNRRDTRIAEFYRVGLEETRKIIDRFSRVESPVAVLK